MDEPYRVFISEDPIGLAGGINKFVYTANDPIRSRDPLGLFGDNPIIRLPRPPSPPPQSCIGGCHPGMPQDSLGGWATGKKECFKCDWQKIGECIAEKYDPEQIEACKNVCESVNSTPPGPARVVAATLCALCVGGKSYEVGSCFADNCRFKDCCEQ
jgi:hypothetical protein